MQLTGKNPSIEPNDQFMSWGFVPRQYMPNYAPSASGRWRLTSALGTVLGVVGVLAALIIFVVIFIVTAA